MKKLLHIVIILAGHLGCAGAVPFDPGAYNTIWLSPSTDEAGSIPLGNGNVGMNLWVEEGGDLLFYVSRGDAYSENLTLCKLGKVRVSLSPNPFIKGLPYRQELKLRDGRCEIEAGEAGHKVKLSVFVDSDSPTIYLTGDCEAPTLVSATIINWRAAKRFATGDALIPSMNGAWIMGSPPANVPCWESADLWQRDEPGALTTYHRNAYSVVPSHIDAQGMKNHADKVLPLDPIRDNTFGMRLAIGSADGCGQVGGDTLRMNKPATRFEIRVTTHAAQTPSTEAWLTQLHSLAEKAVPAKVAGERSATWWNNFWERSWISVSGDKPLLPPNPFSIRLGADSSGGTRFSGEMGRASLMARGLSDREIAKLAAADRNAEAPADHKIRVSTVGATRSGLTATGQVLPKFAGGWYKAAGSAAWDFPDGMTLEAWIKPDGLGGRIWDKCQPGSEQGFTFDIYDSRMRLIMGAKTLLSKEPLKAGEWTHVAARMDSNGGMSIYLNGRESAGIPANPEESTPSMVTRAYVLAKYQMAAQMRSPYPAHFQGGIFTVDPHFAFYGLDIRKLPMSPDYRYYGTNYWWQNLRFLYQPQLAQGNREFHRSLMEFMNKLAPAMKSRAEKYYGAKGIYFEECFTPFGLPSMFDFGWGAKEYSESYARWTWQHCLEASVMMLDDYAYTGDGKFLKETILPYCTSSLEFFDTRFKKSAAGTIRIFPTHALETYWNDVVNDTPSVAGLHYVCRRLLALPESMATSDQRAFWKKVQAALPPIPKTTVNGKVVPDNAEVYQSQHENQGRKARANYEAPDLYTVFPFRIYGLELKDQDIEEARAAWRNMPVPNHVCWYQTGIFAARLGNAEGAKEDVMQRCANRMSRSDGKPGPFRFPGFFGSPHDSCPDYDGPGNMMSVMQEMLLQNGEHGEILLLPAWPQTWAVSFKLHAARNTVVEGVYHDGKLDQLTVTPESRRTDVVLPKGF